LNEQIHLNLENWVDRYTQGDTSVGDQIARAIYPILNVRLKQMGLPEHEVEDVAQQCAIEILRRLDDYEPGLGKFPHWVSGFARQSAKSWRRTQARKVTNEVNTLQDVDFEAEPDQDIADLEALESGLSKLSLIDRELLNMKFSLGMSSEEIAESTDLNSVQVRKRISRAVEKLRNEPAIRSFLKL
jgi:RNA polymerase sigma factor (sigma-70 family)